MEVEEDSDQILYFLPNLICWHGPMPTYPVGQKGGFCANAISTKIECAVSINLLYQETYSLSQQISCFFINDVDPEDIILWPSLHDLHCLPLCS